MKHRSGPLGALLLAVSLIIGACGSSTPKVNAETLLQKAKATADAASTVHFVLTSRDVPVTGTNLVNGKGDLARPDSMQGSFGVAISGFTANVQVVSVGGVFEAKLPFSSRYTKTDPANFGLKDPAQLLDPEHGLTSLLTIARNPTLGPVQRQDGELLQTVSYTVPGSAVPVLPDVAPSQPVDVTVSINPKNHELRTVKLGGPFTSTTSDSTYVVTLSNYDEHVNITVPSTS
jgi:hypothetical protein